MHTNLKKAEVIHYSEYVDLFKYDEGISCHPYIDACNSSIIFRLLEVIGFDKKQKNILDAGSGSGQVVRLLQGIPNINIDACDIDQEAKKFFRENPETVNVPYFDWNIITDKFNKHYDAIIIRGVYHHIPKAERSKLLLNLCSQANFIINADEGILEYESQNQRIEHCNTWYGYVINEAKRRKLSGLAELEIAYLSHEKLNSADDGGDYKESPEELIYDVEKAGLQVLALDKLGNWAENKGGFYTALIAKK